MVRATAIIGVALGLLLLGVALGLLYLDYRELAIAIQQADSMGGDSDDALFTPLLEHPARVIGALISGSIGAALFGGGMVMALFESLTIWRIGTSPDRR